MTVRTSTGFVSRILGPYAFDTVFHNGCIEVYEGPQPATADLAATGVLLARITRDGLAWTPGGSSGGLQFERSGRYAYKAYGHTWRLKGLATGTAGWWRLLPNAYDHGAADMALPRIDGAVRLADSEADGSLTLNTLSITPATDISIDHWWYGMPPLGD